MKASCRKRRYRDRIAALMALASASHAGRDERRAYRCPRCGGWHLTSEELRSSMSQRTPVWHINLGRLALIFVPVRSHRTTLTRRSCALRWVGVLRWNWRRYGRKWSAGWGFR